MHPYKFNPSQFRQYHSGRLIDVYESQAYPGLFVAVNFQTNEVIAELQPKRDTVSYSSGSFTSQEEFDIWTSAQQSLLSIALKRQEKKS